MQPLVEAFLDWIRVERGFSAETVDTYRRGIARFVTEGVVESIGAVEPATILSVKRALMDRGCSPSYIATLLLAMRCFVVFCGTVQGMSVIDPAAFVPPRRPRRAVTYLTSDEVERFVASIKLESCWNGHRRERRPYIPGIQFRALVEVLLGSGMRISEALSLRREGIDWVRHEARVVGKGNKERLVFFTARALHWVRRYLDLRDDARPELFARIDARGPVRRQTVVRWFIRESRRAGLNKRVTAHMLRHTVATTLMFRGCPMGHIKEILGHERLDTTCRYYLGLDQRQAKAALMKWLDYSVDDDRDVEPSSVVDSVGIHNRVPNSVHVDLDASSTARDN